MTTDKLREGRELLAASTPGPWAWYAESDMVVLGTEGSEVFEGHVLTSCKCKACFERGARCTTPKPENAALIVWLRNNAEALLEVAEAAKVWSMVSDQTRQTIAVRELRNALARLSEPK